MTRAVSAFRVAVAVCLLVGCDDEPPVIRRGPILTLNPASLSVVVGQSAPIGVGLAGGATTQTRVRWISKAPAIAAVDSILRVGRSAGDPVPVRGVTVGATYLTVTVVHEGQTITGTIPVTVQAGP